MEQNHSSLFELSIDATTASTIKNSTQWAKIVSICGIIMGGMLVLLGFIFPAILKNSVRSSGMSRYERDSFDGAMATGIGMGMVMYIIIGGLIILGNVFLLNYANKTTRALQTNDQVALNAGMAGLRNYFTFWGIVMILWLLLMIIGVLGILTTTL
ncbi:MAG: hypothetical protein RL115_1536 [Bacteroidota bacterium]|jgi:hypothetical protein